MSESIRDREAEYQRQCCQAEVSFTLLTEIYRGGAREKRGQQASCLVAKQAVEFHRYWLVLLN